MRSIEQIENELQKSLQDASESFIGRKSTQDTRDELKKTLDSIIDSFFKKLIDVEKERHELRVPSSVVRVQRNLDGSVSLYFDYIL
jgi:DNA topoisomerase VI subunit B